MSRNPLVTVYIPCRNYGRFLGQAINSVLKQVYPAWELFLIDEGSSDDTRSVMEAYQGSNANKITLIHHDYPHGLQKTANEVLSLASGEFFMRLDADDWLDENALLLLTARMNYDQTVGMVFGDYYLVNNQGDVISREKTIPLNNGRDLGRRPPHGACTIVRTRSLKAIGGYSEDVDAQDGWELWFKIAQHCSIAKVDLPLFYYRQHSTSLSSNRERLLIARRKIITKMALTMNGSYVPSVVAVVGARESYSHQADVPFQLHEGKTLLENAIRELQEADNVTEIVISTDSRRVLDFVDNLHSKGLVREVLHHCRESSHAEGNLPIRELMISGAEVFRIRHGFNPDVVMFNSLHTVGRTAAHIDNAVQLLRLSKVDSVVSVSEERDLILRNHSKGLSVLNPGKVRGLDLDNEKLFRFNGMILCSWFDVLETGSLLGESIGYVEMSHEESRLFC